MQLRHRMSNRLVAVVAARSRECVLSLEDGAFLTKGVCVSPTRIPEALVHERGQKDDSRRVGTWRCGTLGLDWKGPRWVLKSR